MSPFPSTRPSSGTYSVDSDDDDFEDERDAWTHIASELVVPDGTDEKTDKENEQCIICYDNKRCISLDDCNHLCMCLECTRGFVEKNEIEDLKCPLCKQRIKKFRKIVQC